jgi:FKBP-type peptidyl-prolyl cis-trans isomerase
MIRIENKLNLWIPAAILLLSASGCLQNDWEEKEENEKKLISDYLSANGISEEQKTEGGIYYIEERAGTGLTPEPEDYVIIDYVGRYIDGNAIHETSYDSLKDDWENAVYYTNYVYGPVKFIHGFSLAGINEGLSLMKEGGKATLVLPSDKAFYDFRPMVYEVELHKVITNPVAYEDSVLDEYLVSLGFDSINTYYKGIYYKETVTPDPGDQRVVQTNDTILFRFTGRLVDGFGSEIKDNRVFDTNVGDEEPARMVYTGTSTTRPEAMIAIPDGLKIAFDTLREGTHATFVLPHTQAYKDVGVFSTVYGYTVVPRYQTVVYDITVEDIRSATEK